MSNQIDWLIARVFPAHPLHSSGSVRIHHLNCISACPLGGRWMDARSPSVLRRGMLTCHCLLLELPDELVLVDTGYGLRDVLDPASRLNPFFLMLLDPDFREEMTAARQVVRLGFQVKDVRHIVLTHLDFDHAGGLDDFPNARVHLLSSELGAALTRRTLLDRMRYRPQQWSSRDRWHGYMVDRGEGWFGFERVAKLDGLSPDILLVPLAGHTLGHCGVAVRTDDSWLMLAGDAYCFSGEMSSRPWCTPGLRFYQWLMEKDRRARLANQARLRELVADHPDEVTVVCSHDPHDFMRVAGRFPGVPADALRNERRL
jgi:glyoxylase-like metal-dependent hydrolase (beta-lactamase superfamily II)